MPKCRSYSFGILWKLIEDIPFRTLADLLLDYDTSLAVYHRISAVFDVANGVQYMYLHDNGLIHGDIKPLNILICGETEEDFVFKITDYSCIGSKMNAHAQFSSKSVSMK